MIKGQLSTPMPFLPGGSVALTPQKPPQEGIFAPNGLRVSRRPAHPQTV